MTSLILASQSPRRRTLLEEAGFSPIVMPADIDETRRANESPTELVERLAREKAHACQEALGASAHGARADKRTIVAADTIVWVDDGSVLGKPADEDAARAMLRELSGKTHHVSTGVCLVLLDEAAQTLAEKSFVETTSVSFFPLTDAEIDAYVATGEPMDKAGAYGIQGAARLFVSGIDGDWANVVGLPVARLVRELDSLYGGHDLIAELLLGGN